MNIIRSATRAIFAPSLVIALLLVGSHASAVQAAGSKVFYEEATQYIANPDRGFYKQLGGGDSHRIPSPIELATPLASGMSNYTDVTGATVFRIYLSLREFKDRPIDQPFLDNLEGHLKRAEEIGVTLIPRFFYAWGYELGKPFTSPSRERIKGHVSQVAAVINANHDAISFVEMGFIGAWGEWHSDQYGAGEKEWTPFRLELVKHMRQEFDPSIYLALRYASDWNRINRTGEVDMSRIGLHHDCPNYYNDVYVRAKGELVTPQRPQGGEVCELAPRGKFGKGDFEKYYGCDVMIPYFDKFNFDVLNHSDWSQSNSRFERQGCWKEIRDRLGYRFVITESSYENGMLSFTVKNRGFGKSFKSRSLSLDVDGKRISTSIDLKNWQSGGTYTHDIDIGSTDSDHIKIYIDNNIRFANKTGNTIFLKQPSSKLRNQIESDFTEELNARYKKGQKFDPFEVNDPDVKKNLACQDPTFAAMMGDKCK